jgi:GDPmannose 4,6-dehydratase
VKRALILGIGGQDGSYLAEVLLSKGYAVYGTYRRTSGNPLHRIQHIKNKLNLFLADVTDTNSVLNIINNIVQPCEIYNEADQDNVGYSFETPNVSFETTFAAVGRLLEGLAVSNYGGLYFQPCSATMFDTSIQGPMGICHNVYPMSPYACMKTAAFDLCRFYREHYRMDIVTGIMFNHDSPRRSEGYLLQKICQFKKRQDTDSGQLSLGPLSQEVDIGYAKEYMEAAWACMQQPIIQDWIIGTGKCYTIGDLVQAAGIDLSRIVLNESIKKAEPLIADTTDTDPIWKARTHGPELIKLLLNGDAS